ncbi:acetate--CoA ligase [Capnocytophaga canimorsus]|uniref:acetate--CoA ligase n=1 Tax=Capnocytophaga canimorsus TaxID=28188 RepID=UPI001EDED5EE|nr:acetate--CoA ligase [Capnocytophaga canimorsus]GJQ04939.1 hypothetical protein CAPN009_13540 [Capnocytophaga canimorsus]
MSYQEKYNESMKNTEAFWMQQTENIRWFEAPTIGLFQENGQQKWFKDGKTNLCYLALDRHIERGFGDKVALVYDSFLYQQKVTFTFNEAKGEVERLAGGLSSLGVTSGDVVLIFMPMIPQTIFSMLACTRIGAVHAIVYGGLSATDLEKHINHVRPKVIITASSGIENDAIVSYKPIVDKAIDKAKFKPQHVVLFNRKLGAYQTVQKYDIDYHEFVKMATPMGCRILPSSHPSSVVFVTDTDNVLRGMVRDTGGFAVSLAYSMRNVLDVSRETVFMTSFNLDTIVGSDFSVYAPLILGACTVIYEGESSKNMPPDEIWRLVEEYKISHFMLSPSVMRHIKNRDPKGKAAQSRDISSLKYMFFTGERFELTLFDYIKRSVQATITNLWLPSEAGVPVIAHCMGLEHHQVSTSDIGRAVPGYKIQVLSDMKGELLSYDQEGVLAYDYPLAPGFVQTYWNNPNQFEQDFLAQYPGYFSSSYFGSVDKDGYFHISGKVTDQILVAGKNISAVELEQVIIAHPMVCECAVVGLEDESKGNVPIAVVVPNPEFEFYDSVAMENSIKQHVMKDFSTLGFIDRVLKVKRLPRCKEGRLLRDSIRRMLNGKKYEIPSAISNPEVFDELIHKFKRKKIGAFSDGNQTANSLKILADRYYNIDSLSKYIDVYRISQSDPIDFWETVATNNFFWRRRWEQAFKWDKENHHVEWFSGAKLNITENCIDRHLGEKGQQTAIIWEPNHPDDQAQHITYAELSKRVNKMANVLKDKGIKKGDRVCIYLPMIPELAVSVLACARIGAVHSVVFAGFSSTALATRINDAQCKMVITSDGASRGEKIIDLKSIVDEALKDNVCVESVLVVDHLQSDVSMLPNRDYWLKSLLQEASEQCPATEMDAEDMLFILYTSGSTGKPKGIVHTTAGYMVYSAFTFNNVFQYKSGDVYWCTADIGWITGHSYILYGPLLNGATTVIFEGAPSYPDFGRYWQIVEKHKVTQFYTAPTAIRSLAKQSIEFTQKYDLSSLKILGSVGEPINEEAWHWYNDHIGKKKCPIADTWWQTETGGIMIAPIPFATPTKPTYATLPLPGIFPVLMGENNQEITANSSEGHLCISHPWPGMARTIYGNHNRYVETYFSTYEGKYFTGDGALRDEVGYYRITGRVDDVIIVSGHNLGTAPIEDAINEHPAVSESAIVGFPHEVKGNALYGYIILKDEGRVHDNVRKEINQIISDKIGAIAKLDKIQIVSGLPRTRSGKIMRRILRKIAMHDTADLGDTSTLLNPEIINDIIEGAL